MKISKILSLTVLACFATLAVASPVYEEDGEINLPGIMLPSFDDENDDPKPCCLPDSWQSNITGQSASEGGRGDDEDTDRKHRRRGGGFQQRTTTVFVDQTKPSVAGRTACRNDTCGFLVQFGTNNTAKVYLFALGAQKCKTIHSKRAVFRKQCIPANATYEGNVKIGPADGGLDAQVWGFHGNASRNGSRHGGVFISGKALVTSACVPIVFQNHGFVRRRGAEVQSSPNSLKFQSQDDMEIDPPGPGPRSKPNPHPARRWGGGGFMGSSFFTNFVTPVKDATVFIPPSYCNTTSAWDDTSDLEYPDILDTFVDL